MKSYNTTRRNWDFLPGFRVATRTLWFVSQLEITKTGQLDAISDFQCITYLFEKSLDHIFGLTLVKANFFEKQVSELSFG